MRGSTRVSMQWMYVSGTYWYEESRHTFPLNENRDFTSLKFFFPLFPEVGVFDSRKGKCIVPFLLVKSLRLLPPITLQKVIKAMKDSFMSARAYYIPLSWL